MGDRAKVSWPGHATLRKPSIASESMAGLCLRGGLLIRRRGRRARPAFGHELVELGLVLGEAQALEEGAELLLLFLQAAEGLGLVFIEGAVAGRRGRAVGRIRRPRTSNC